MARRESPMTTWLNRLHDVPMFSACSKKELRELAKRAEHIEVGADRVLVTEGKTGHEFFVLVDGEARVTRNGRRVATLGPGAYFGELALLARTPRNATVTTTQPSELVVLGRTEFDSALRASPALAVKLLTGLATRLSEIDAKV